MRTTLMPVIELNGSAYERGYYFGERNKKLIAKLICAWRTDLGSFGLNQPSEEVLNIESYIDGFLNATDFMQSINRWVPHLFEELEGIASGAGQSISTIFAFNLVDEEWIYGLQQQLARPTEKCTAFGIAQPLTGNSFAGQNMDIASWFDTSQQLLRVMPHQVNYFGNRFEAPEALVFSVAGNIGLNGLNANGVGVTCNTLYQLQPCRTGLPVSFIVRSVLEQPDIDQAEAYLRTIQHASGQNYILSSANEMRCFECCGSGVIQYEPEDALGRVFHSNHPLIHQDFSDIADLTARRLTNSKARLASVYGRLGDPERAITLQDIKSALAAHDDPDHPVSRNSNHEGNSIGFTAGASIYEFGPKPRLHLAAGPPCETDFQTFEFNTL